MYVCVCCLLFGRFNQHLLTVQDSGWLRVCVERCVGGGKLLHRMCHLRTPKYVFRPCHGGYSYTTGPNATKSRHANHVLAQIFLAGLGSGSLASLVSEGFCGHPMALCDVALLEDHLKALNLRLNC